jgi:hypothetical protein
VSWLGQTTSIAVGIAGGVWLAGVLRGARWWLGHRLYAYAARVQSRAAARHVASIAEPVE